MDPDEYDGGSATVPDGVVGPVDRVVVIGAGMAGLTVANALAHAGVECRVLEARDRLGGRLHTIDLAGGPVDMGGSWIHQPEGNPLRTLAYRGGIACRGADPTPRLTGHDLALGTPLTAGELDRAIELLPDEFRGALPALRADLGPGASAAEGIDSFLAAAQLAPVEHRRARQALRALVEADAADLPEEQSLRWLWEEVEYGGSYLGDVPVGGYRRLVELLAGGLDVRLGDEVTDVAVHADGVRVVTADGRVEEGSHVVVTVPLGVLRTGALRFTPPLPAERHDLAGPVGFGHYEKVALRFAEPFWQASGLSHLAVFPADPAESTVWLVDLDDFEDGPTLVCHVFHSAAGRVLDATPDVAADWVLGMLGAAVGRPCPHPVAVATTSWGRDPFTRGAYSHLRPGGAPEDMDGLGRPLHGRLMFAGEHTQSARPGYADGAMGSGVREAKRLLGRPSVRLGAVDARPTTR